MTDSVFCPVCGVKLCEIAQSKDLKVKCRRCKHSVTIDVDSSEPGERE